MAEKRLQALSVWTDVECNSGTQSSAFVVPLEAKSVVGLDGTERLTVTVDTGEAAWSDVDIGTVLRTEFTNGDWDEWRVYSYETQRSRDGVTAEIVALGIRYDLRYRAGLAERIEANGYADLDWTLVGLTPSQWIDEFLLFPDWPDWINKGTVNPTAVQSIPLGPEVPLDACMELEYLSGAELDVRRDSNVDYKLDLVTARGSSAEKAYLHGLVNLQRVKNKTTAIIGPGDGQITRAYPVGGGDEGFRITMGRNLWTVDATGATTIDLADDAIGSPIRYDDQLNNLYVEKSDGTNRKQITDTDQANQRLTVGASHGFSATDEVRIVRDTNGAELTYLEHPTSLAAYGQLVGVVERQDFPNVNQLLSSDIAFLSGTYTGGVANGWNKIGAPTCTEETSSNYIKHGTSTQKVVAADTEGVITDAISVSPSASEPFLTAQIHIMVTALSAGVVRFQLSDETNTVEYPADAVAAAHTSKLNEWVRIDIQPGVNFSQASTASVKLKVWADGGTATFYVDAAQLSDRATPPSEFVNGRVSNALWHAANDILDDYNAPLSSLDIGVIDLDRVSDTDFVFKELVVGGTVIIVDEDLSLDAEARIVELRQNLLEPGDTQITLSNKPQDLAGILGKRTRRRAQDLAPPAGNSFLVAVPDDLDAIADGTTYKRVGNVNASNEITNTSVASNNVEWSRLKFAMASGNAWALAGRHFEPGIRNALETGYTTYTTADGTMLLVPHMAAASDTIVDISMSVATAGTGNARILVYENKTDGSFYPGDLLYESGNIDVSTTGTKTQSGANISVVSGKVYWYGWVTDTTADPGLRGASGASARIAAPLFGKTTLYAAGHTSALTKTGESFPAADPAPAGMTATANEPRIGCTL